MYATDVCCTVHTFIHASLAQMDAKVLSQEQRCAPFKEPIGQLLSLSLSRSPHPHPPPPGLSLSPATHAPSHEPFRPSIVDGVHKRTPEALSTSQIAIGDTP